MRLRQVALVAADLGARVDELVDVLGLGRPYADPGVALFGLENAVFPVGDQFLEVVSPEREATSAGRLLERRGGDGGYMVIVQVAELADARARAEAEGVRVVWETQLEDMATVHLHPRDLGGAIVSIDWADPPSHWRWGGPDWRERSRADVVSGLAGVEVQCDDPNATAARWGAVLGMPVDADGGGPHVRFDEGGWVRFVPATDGRGEGVSAVAFHARDAETARATARARGLVDSDGAIQLCGVRVELVEGE